MPVKNTREKSVAFVTSIMKETQLNDFDSSSKNVGFTKPNLMQCLPAWIEKLWIIALATIPDSNRLWVLKEE